MMVLNGVSNVVRGVTGAVGGCVSRVRRRKSVAVLVDAESVSAKRLSQVVEAARKIGRVMDVRVYGPVALLNSEEWRSAVSIHGAVRVPCAERKAEKGSAGVRIAVDAMGLMIANDAAAFVLASDRIDFVPLARKLREAGKRVVGVSRVGCSAHYRKAFDRFLEISDRKGAAKSTRPSVMRVERPHVHARVTAA